VTSGKMIISDTMNSCLRKVESNLISTWPATMPGGSGLYNPQGVATYYNVALKKFFLYIADQENHRIRRLDTVTNVLDTVAGKGSAGYAGNGGQATDAQLDSPSGVAVDASGNIFIADTRNNRVRKVAAGTNIITKVAGSGNSGGPGGYSGDGGDALFGELNAPQGVSVDRAGNIYIADTNNHRIRKVAVGGIISTVAGRDGGGVNDNDNVEPATNKKLNFPSRVAVDVSNNIYIADTNSHRIRLFTVGGNISTVAGDGSAGYSGDGAAATAAQLRTPQGVSVDGAGNIYIADTGNHALRLVNIHTGVISTVAGTNTNNGYNGDSQPAALAWLRSPGGVALGLTKGGGRIYIGDTRNNRVRVLFLKTEPQVYGKPEP
jgi:sugar lactone lactonase YvrE